MKIARIVAALFLSASVAFVGTSCRGKKAEVEALAPDVPEGASYKPSKGVILTEEMSKTLGIEVQDVTEKKLPGQLRFGVQIFGEKNSGSEVDGSGVLLSETALSIRVGAPVQFQSRSNEVFQGTVIEVKKALTPGENEIIVGVTNAAGKLKAGEFLSAVVTLQREEAVTVIPRSALLRAVDGSFVYTVNGDSYFRTPVKVGSEADDMVEIIDGLLPGDAVVSKGIDALWLIELRATKGGAGCTH